MASPPFNLDISDPTDGALGSAFPANERTFRDNINSYLNTEHDINTGYHQIQELTTTNRTALTSPPTGMLVYTTDATPVGLYINTGTSGSPTWTLCITLGAFNASGWLYKLKANGSGSYSALVGDSGTLFHSGSAGGTLTVTLPNVGTLADGWYALFQRRTNGMTVAVNGSASEHILVPDGLTLTTLDLYAADYEYILLVFDGTNYNAVSISPNTYQSLNSGVVGTPGLGGQIFTSSGAFTIPTGATKLKVTVQGGGGGGGGGANSGSGNASSGSAGGTAVKFLSGLTPGGTLTVARGAGGTSGPGGSDGGAGNDSTVSSGTQSISTITGGAGVGGKAGSGSTAGTGVAGGTATGGDYDIGGMGSQTGSSVNTPGNLYADVGAGGAGGLGNAGGTGGAGNVGTNGVVIFEWWN